MDKLITQMMSGTIKKIKTTRLEESWTQRAFVKYCRMHPDPRINMTFSIHNSGKKKPVSYGRDIAEGLLAGVADICIPYPTATKHALFLEFKSSKGKQNDNQRRFEIFCHGHGYGYEVVRSTQEAIDQLKKHTEES